MSAFERVPNQRLSQFAFLVIDYDQAIEWFTRRLGWSLVEDTHISVTKRWVRVAPSLDATGLLLARAVTEAQLAAVGKQFAGRVGLFLETDDFLREHSRLTAAGINFVESPRTEPYGTVSVFEDLYGNRWDLIGKR